MIPFPHLNTFYSEQLLKSHSAKMLQLAFGLLQDTVYEYFVDPKNRSWVNFEEKLQKGWRYPPKYAALSVH